MNIKTFSYRFAEEILTHPIYESVYNEILTICRNCPLPVYPGKSNNQQRLDVVQQIINTYFKIAFSEDNGWIHEPQVSPSTFADTLRADFKKEYTFTNNNTGEIKNIVTQIEVEMGNIASSYRNYFKFQLSYSHNLAQVGILILPCDNLSRRIDSGVASFEKTAREIPSADLSITVPILVIGLDDTGVIPIDVSHICTDMAIVKGSSNTHIQNHMELVNQIITLNNDR
ncbi:BglII/BstYI family type II restriction endonuclease [Aliarcobacter butzleri]|uniref:BglII/BstYI family type II restriction endonuclease n=1 Tax=Aliarcobacter butzleri TaxID=28197 RepID=UPI00263CDC67|nr:BglII/BstYI family type II restriction endonuclease [Aliarcobacter butzleri]MDN5060562.1 BglII/BstYI family type II restriction endonuclease [Aliarcobacter butzleri]